MIITMKIKSSKIEYSLLGIVVFTILISIILLIDIQSYGKVPAISDNTDIQFEVLPFTTIHSGNLSIINPLYVEHFTQVIENKSKGERNQNTTKGSFSGKGLLGGDINVSVNGTAKVVTIENMSVYISGRAEFISSNGNIAPYTFQAIGHYKKDGSFNSAGSMFFNSTTTGELSFLKNTIGIFKDVVKKDGTGLFLMWRWN